MSLKEIKMEPEKNILNINKTINGITSADIIKDQRRPKAAELAIIVCKIKTNI